MHSGLCVYPSNVLFNLEQLKMSNCQQSKWHKFRIRAESL